MASHTEQKQTRAKAGLITCTSRPAPAADVSAQRCGEKADLEAQT